MAVRSICIYPEPVLGLKAQLVEKIDNTLQQLIDDMIETMYAAPGIGLAAPQVGVSVRLFVVDVTGGRGPSGLMTFINPEILQTTGRTREDEGCLSVPEINRPTPRFANVLVRGTNRDGQTIEIAGEGLLARVFQHEFDHLQGLLFFDRMGPVARDLIKRKYRRAQRQGR